jgi:TRAP-type C4-dicarboxylate transport system permease large subunit
VKREGGRVRREEIGAIMKSGRGRAILLLAGAMLGVVLLLVRIFVRLVYKRKKMSWRDCANGAVLAFWPVMILVFISLGASNVIFSAIGATISVILILFLIRKV